MRAKHPIRIVRDATGMTQEKFAQALGVSRCYVANVERRRKPFTAELQRKVAILTGAWIDLRKAKNPAPPVVIESWSASVGGESPEPWFKWEPQPYEKIHWERWRGDWKEKASGEPSLRFDGDNEALAFWLVLLIAAGERAGAAHAVRAEILHALERVRSEYQLAPHLAAILRQYKPLCMEERPPSASGLVPTAEWNPASRPPRWLREAVEMEPLRLHVTPPGTEVGRFTVNLRKIVREGKETFLALLSQNPARAVKWARENRSSGHWLVSLAERVGDRKRSVSMKE